MKRLLFAGWLLSMVSTTIAQEIDLENFAERLFQVQSEDAAYEDIYESLLLFYTDQLNLNEAEEDELSSLFILSPVQVHALLEHREEFGNLISIYELQAIPHFDLETIQNLIPFVTIGKSGAQNKPLLQRIRDERNKYFLLRATRIVEQQRGFREGEENGYLGSPEKIYGRFRASRRNDFSLGFTFEKDAGETLDRMDFYSFHGMLENQGLFSKIIVGDFQMQVGQGLVFGSGFNPGKGAETVNTVKRNTLGVRPYTSVLETGFFRGVGVTIPTGKIEITAFASRLLQDGRLQQDTLDDQFDAFVNSIQRSGLHRTETEFASRDQITESNLGGYLTYRSNRKLSIGLSGLATSFDENIVPTDATYKRFDFRGDQNQLGSLFGSYQWNSLNMFGEFARSSSGGTAMVAGVLASPSRAIDLAFSVRDYQRDFNSFYGNAFGEATNLRNEKGMYWGIKYSPSRKYTLVAYYDKFKFPWLRFGVDAPSQGAEWLSRLTYRPSREVSVFLQVREESKEVSISEVNLSKLRDRIKRNYILNVDYATSKNLSFRTRLQASSQDEAGTFTKGFAIIQDLNYNIGRFRISGRMAMFETDDYDNRQYVYERDVLYAFSIPAYNGRGIRNYLLVRYQVSDKLDFWMRYGRFSYRDQNSVGSGLDESEGPYRTEIKWMMRVVF